MSSTGNEAATVQFSEKESKRPRISKICSSELQNVLSDKYLGDDQLTAGLAAAFQSQKDWYESKTEAIVTAKPFPLASLPGFLDESFSLKLREVVHREALKRKKSSDLYDLYQTQDFKGLKDNTICQFKDAFCEASMIEFMSKLTGLPLSTEVVDMSGQLYDNGCYLACHDDELEGRAVAFILYLVAEDWSAADGGTLDLFDVSEQALPADVAYSLVPQWNTLTFFQVTPTSYHQVSEVLQALKPRLSVSGWFHFQKAESRIPRPMVPTDLVDIRKRHRLVLTESLLEGMSIDGCAEFQDWISPSYLKPVSIETIRKRFLDESAVELQKFLTRDAYEELYRSLLSLTWRRVGPVCFQNYDSLNLAELSTTSGYNLYSFRNYVVGPAFREFLESFTSLKLVYLSAEIRRFGRGNYTLLDDDSSLDHNELEVTFVLTDGADMEEPLWSKDWGGQTVYISEGDELLTTWPRTNSLSVVLLDRGCTSFVKYVNHQADQRKNFELVLRFSTLEEPAVL